MTMNRKIFALMAAPIVIALSICANPVMVRAGDDFADLAPLLQAEKDAYLEARDALLKERREPWDVNAASNVSWELGLAAFILNARQAKPEAFERLDKVRAAPYRAGWYVFKGHKSVSDKEVLACLLERVWKKIPVTPTGLDEAKCAYETLFGARKPVPANRALWETLWRQSEDDRFRGIAVFHLCADPDPATQPIILEVLEYQGAGLAAYSKYRCLDGFAHRDTEETVDAILKVWDLISADDGGLLTAALRVLSVNRSARARPVLYDFILDEKAEKARKSRVSVEMNRKSAVAMLCSRPHPDDVEVIRQFLAGPGSVNMKTDALRSLGECPIDYIRPVLREILAESDEPRMIAKAAFALAQTYGNVIDMHEAELSAARAEDALLLEEVLRRHPDLPTATRVHLGMRIEGFRAKPGDPRPRLPDRPPDK